MQAILGPEGCDGVRRGRRESRAWISHFYRQRRLPQVKTKIPRRLFRNSREMLRMVQRLLLLMPHRLMQIPPQHLWDHVVDQHGRRRGQWKCVVGRDKQRGLFVVADGLQHSTVGSPAAVAESGRIAVAHSVDPWAGAMSVEYHEIMRVARGLPVLEKLDPHPRNSGSGNLEENTINDDLCAHFSCLGVRVPSKVPTRSD